jgi:hypothetical protein
MKVQLPVDTEFVFYCVVHCAEPGYRLANLIAQSVRLAKFFTPRLAGLTELKEAHIAAEDGSEIATHDGNRSYGPHLVEDKPHYDQGHSIPTKRSRAGANSVGGPNPSNATK